VMKFIPGLAPCRTASIGVTAVLTTNTLFRALASCPTIPLKRVPISWRAPLNPHHAILILSLVTPIPRIILDMSGDHP